LLDALPAAVYTTDAAGRITFYNEAAVELWGCRPELGKSEWCGSWKLFWPDGRPLPHETCPMAVALKEDRAVRGAEAIAERPDGTRIPFIPYPTPLHDASGKLVGAVNMLVDITDRKRAEEQQALLVRELHHRVKNMLATVQAIMGSTARASTSMEEFQDTFTGRIMALARTHSSLAQDEWQMISLRDLMCNELDPYEDGSRNRIHFDGPEVDLPSTVAIPLGMAIHELTTNAVKHGALSVLGGSVAVSWVLAGEGDRRELDIMWVERDGPTIEPPTRKGFGSQLLERVLKNQIGASATISYESEGLRAHVVVPLLSRRFVPAPMNSLSGSKSY
jgi:PAS domain S-box-containing protein